MQKRGIERSNADALATRRAVPVTNHRRLVAAPISWGICEVPGWGRMLDAERVLGEMASLGMARTELGAPGFLPDDDTALRDTLDRHGLGLAASFWPVVAH